MKPSLMSVDYSGVSVVCSGCVTAHLCQPMLSVFLTNDDLQLFVISYSMPGQGLAARYAFLQT